jgi:hypothetical protein
MAKKPAAPTPCEQGGPEVLPLEVRVLSADVSTFTIRVCRTNAQVTASIQPIAGGPAQTLFSTTGQLTSSAILPALPKGRYALFWSILVAATPWQTRADLDVNRTIRFLRRKTDAGNNPVNMGFLLIEVV